MVQNFWRARNDARQLSEGLTETFLGELWESGEKFYEKESNQVGACDVQSSQLKVPA